MKLLLTCIFKGDSEYDNIERMLKSFMPYMSGLCVAITGQEENKRIKAIVKRYKGRYIETNKATHPKIYLQDGTFGNFAEARNVCFKLAEEMQKEGKYDWWTWADADDILVNGQELDLVAKKALEFNVDLVFFTYWYSINMKGNSFSEKDVQIDHLRERLIKPNMFKWVSRLHEIALPLDGNYKPNNTLYEYNPKEGRACVWAHLPSEGQVMKSMERNIKILEEQAREEENKDPRTVFYLAKTNYDLAGMGKPELYQLCDMLLDDYLEKSGWAEERANAWQYKGDIRSIWGKHREAIECYHRAIQEFGNRHMPFLLLAREYSEVGDDEQAQFWLDIAMKMDPPTTRTTIGNPLQIKFMAASLKFNDCIKKNDIKGSIGWLKVIEELTGQKDERLETLEELNLRNDAAMWIFNYAKWLKDTGHKEKIKHVIEALPIELGREVFAHVISNEYREPKTWDDKSIVYYASFGGEHFEPWSAKNLETGIGGSETAVIELCKRWVDKGYNVTIYGDPREDEGVHDGVMYRPWYEFNWNDEFNILILWRSPHLLDRPIKAKKLFMDLHDVASQLDWTDERMKKIDKVFFKSNFHRKMIPKLPDEKVMVISNGI